MHKKQRRSTIYLSLLIAFFFLNAIHISDVGPEKNTHETYNIKALKIPENLTFAGEKVPTDRYDIRERMDRELLVNTYWQSNGLLMMKRANKFVILLVDSGIIRTFNVGVFVFMLFCSDQ